MTRTLTRTGTLAVALAVGLTGIAIVGAGNAGAEDAGARIGEKAPPFTLSSHDGREVNLKDFEGKIVVLEWTNPDCPFVQRHYKAGTMTTLASELAESDVVWLAVNSTHYFDGGRNKKWAGEHEIPYPILNDSAGDVGRLYGARTTPHMFVIDRDGTLAYAGAIDDDPRGKEESPTGYVRAAVTALLSGEKVASAETRPYGCSVKYAKTEEPAKSAAS